jgi:protein SCO1/2
MSVLRWLSLVMLIVLLGAGRDALADSSQAGEFAVQARPGALLPLSANLQDESGRAVTLGEFFTGVPIILDLEYLRCRTLCGLTLAGLVTRLAALPLVAGRDYRLLAVSIDPRDTPADAAAAKAKYLGLYGRPGGDAGFVFLTGRAAETARIADAAGFRYAYDAALDQYSHPAGVVVAAPDGHISRYLPGVSGTTDELRDALSAARQSSVSGPLQQILLLCRLGAAPGGRFATPLLAAFTAANLAAMIALIAVFAAIRRRRNG